MDSGNKYIAFALVIIVAFILQVALVMIDQKETPAGAAIEFAKAYYKLDQSMADQLCRAIIENDEEIDVVDDFLQRSAETARTNGFDRSWMRSYLYHIETETRMTDENTVEVRIAGNRKRYINPVFALVAKLFFLGEVYKVDATLSLTKEDDGFEILLQGLWMTIYVTLVAFVIALVLGLLAGLGRISHNMVIRNIATTYIEFIRGVPTLVLIFTLAFVIVPALTDVLGIDNRSIKNDWRAIIALSTIYGAFLAEIFRAGIESIPKGQMEAARSLGMTYGQAMRVIILPQAIRNISPALGNDFIAMLKDSSLVSVLAVRDLTQMARLYAGSSFRFRESYLVLTFFYLTLTIMLSLLLRWFEKRMGKEGK